MSENNPEEKKTSKAVVEKEIVEKVIDNPEHVKRIGELETQNKSLLDELNVFKNAPKNESDSPLQSWFKFITGEN